MSSSRHPDFAAFRYCPLTDVQRQQYEEEGYVLLGQTLSDAGLEMMRRQCMVAWDAKKEKFDPEQTWLINSLLPNIHHHSKLARRFYFDGPLVDVAERVIGPNIKGVTTQLTFKLRGNTMPFGWHQDNGYGELDPYTAISTLTALDDSDPENGCLWLIPRSHRRGQVEVGHTIEDKKSQRDINLDVDDSQAIPLPMKAGDSLFFNCWMLHKSDGNHSPDRDRRILFMRYADADAIEVYNQRKPRLGCLLRGRTKFSEVEVFERELKLVDED